MKSKFICTALLCGVNAQRAFGPLERPGGDDRSEDERRYFQLTKMMKFYNPDFDQRRYWTYGCNCLILGIFFSVNFGAWVVNFFCVGDRPMSDPGHGPPIDALDKVCKAYKDCLKCARMQYGESCIGEFHAYEFGRKRKEMVCRDNPADGQLQACRRKLCECDAQFARNHVGQAHVFDPDYHLFWSTLPNGWEPKDNCPRGGGGPYTPECCGTPTTPDILFNGATRQCCAGVVRKEC